MAPPQTQLIGITDINIKIQTQEIVNTGYTPWRWVKHRINITDIVNTRH
jgi:hypothetical protein